MLKVAMASSIFLALICAPIVFANDSSSVTENSGFGSASLPSDTTNTQYPESAQQGDEPLAEPAATSRTGTQSHNRNLPNLPQCITAMPFNHSFKAPGSLALQSQGLTELPDARFAILSQPELSPGSLPDARYAVLSERPASKFVAKTIAPTLSKLASPILNISKPSEGY